MATTTISLPDDQLARLRLHAAMKRRPLNEIIGEAVEAYLAQCPDLTSPRATEANGLDAPSPYVTEPVTDVRDPEWRARFDAALAAIRAQVPSDMTPEEIEQEITLAWEEARQERKLPTR